MLHVNNRAGHTIAVSENRQLARIAKSTLLWHLCSHLQKVVRRCDPRPILWDEAGAPVAQAAPVARPRAPARRGRAGRGCQRHGRNLRRPARRHPEQDRPQILRQGVGDLLATHLRGEPGRHRRRSGSAQGRDEPPDTQVSLRRPGRVACPGRRVATTLWPEPDSDAEAARIVVDQSGRGRCGREVAREPLHRMTQAEAWRALDHALPASDNSRRERCILRESDQQTPAGGSGCRAPSPISCLCCCWDSSSACGMRPMPTTSSPSPRSSAGSARCAARS